MSKKIEILETDSGVRIGKFLDRRWENCAIQTSPRGEPLLGLGIHTKRMFLSRELTAALLPLMAHFVNTGELPLVTDEQTDLEKKG